MKKTILLATVALLSLSSMAIDRKGQQDRWEEREQINPREWQELKRDRKPVTSQLRATTNLLDSIVSVNSDGSYNSKQEYAYDENGNQTMAGEYRWNSDTDQWVGRLKIEYAYDTNSNRTMITRYDWDRDTDQWIGWYKSESTYDGNENITINISYNWNRETNQWIESYRYEYTYDENGNRTMGISFDWNSETNQWVESSKSKSTHDENDNETMYVSYVWDSTISQWVESSKYEYAYDENGDETMYASYNWDKDTDQWVETGRSKAEYTYDENRIMNVIRYNWNSRTNQWAESFKAEYTYDDNGNQTMRTSYDWHMETAQWAGSKIEYTYDENNKETMRIGYYWDSYSNQWVKSSQAESTYNSDGCISTVKYYYPNKGEWIHDYTAYHYYSAYELTDIGTPQLDNTVQIYLNSAINTLHIKTENNVAIQAGIYNLQGQLLLQTSQTEIDFSAYPAGVYIVKVNTDTSTETMTQKILKK